MLLRGHKSCTLRWCTESDKIIMKFTAERASEIIFEICQYLMWLRQMLVTIESIDLSDVTAVYSIHNDYVIP